LSNSIVNFLVILGKIQTSSSPQPTSSKTA
jgi:hypothetical protein